MKHTKRTNRQAQHRRKPAFQTQRTTAHSGQPSFNYIQQLRSHTHWDEAYDNAILCHYNDYQAQHPESTFYYDELPEHEVEGLPLCSTRDAHGRLRVTFTENTHVLAVGATRSGKTTGYIIPTVNFLRARKNKPSMVISDPKLELYHQTARGFEQDGYRVHVVNFLDHRHSDHWNPLTTIFRTYQKYLHVEECVTVTEVDGVVYNQFEGRVYQDQTELEAAIRYEKQDLFSLVDNLIISLAQSVCPVQKVNDPYWELTSANLIQGFLWGMLEDSDPATCDNPITEKTFSFDTMLRIFEKFNVFDDTHSMNDAGYFSTRPETSRAKELVYNSIIRLSATSTRSCIMSSFLTAVKKLQDISIRNITKANSFDMEALDEDVPTVIFVAYKDEEKLHYDIISMFISQLYTTLISIARKKQGKLERPFYFLLDEFGNFPAFASFENVISACGGRNIWFLLVVQSYAQLYRVYGKDTAEIIIDNLNMHIFFGSNNPATKQSFSGECGNHVIISPMSALRGGGEHISTYEKENVPLVPVSRLSYIQPGECIVTQMRGDVLWSHMERSYLCPEFACDTYATPPMTLFDPAEYTYNYKPRRRKSASTSDIF